MRRLPRISAAWVCAVRSSRRLTTTSALLLHQQDELRLYRSLFRWSTDARIWRAVRRTEWRKELTHCYTALGCRLL